MLGTIAITDFGWYEFLSQRRKWDEVNFWTPSARFGLRAPEFSPFLFKLRAPHNAIADFGYFAEYAALPDWLAWECFGEGNGCSSLDEMRPSHHQNCGRVPIRLTNTCCRGTRKEGSADRHHSQRRQPDEIDSRVND